MGVSDEGVTGSWGWRVPGYPAPQGPFYCGVGSEAVYGRPLAEAHMDACIKVRRGCMSWRLAKTDRNLVSSSTCASSAPLSCRHRLPSQAGDEP
jgi:hypothetical protein